METIPITIHYDSAIVQSALQASFGTTLQSIAGQTQTNFQIIENKYDTVISSMQSRIDTLSELVDSQQALLTTLASAFNQHLENHDAISIEPLEE